MMRLEAHLSELPLATAGELRSLVQRLRAVPPRRPRADLASRIQVALGDELRRERARARRRRILWSTALAAGVAALLTFYRLTGSAPVANDEGLAVLVATQEADGSWNPAQHGGRGEYRPALTALAALALAQDLPRQQVPLARACQALCAMQSAAGDFGGTERAQYYNQALATCALATLLPAHPQAQATVARAVACSTRWQSAAGGWDYEAGSEGNSAMTAWQVRALGQARAHGIAAANVPWRKGLRWLRGMAHADGSVGYHLESRGDGSECLAALTAHALLEAGRDFPELKALGHGIAAVLSTQLPAHTDYYRDYAKILAFESAGASGRAGDVRRTMQSHLRAQDADQWMPVGGALYARALTALALHK